MNQPSYESDLENRPAVSLMTVAISTLAIILAVFTAVIVIPSWFPGMLQSMSGENIKAYWYLSRGSAVIAYLLLWVSMILGLLMTNKMARFWPGAPTAYDLHEYVSLLGLAFVLFHALILTGDTYIKTNLLQTLIPFGSINYKPLQVAVGQFGFYLWLVLIGTFYIRKKIGNKTWRLIHFASFVSFLLAMIHGITSGTDTSTGWMQLIYWGSAVSIFFLTIYRIFMALAVRWFPANQKKSPSI